MTQLSRAKALGGVGSICALLTFTPYAGAIIAIVGLILVLVAVKDIADYTHERSIFNDLIISDVLGIAGLVVAGVIVFAAVFRFVGIGPAAGPTDIFSLITSIIVGLFLFWILAVISAFYLKKSYDMIATKLNVNLFRTSALLNLIGALLAIILIGFILIFIAQILFVAAFFSIPDTQAPTGMSPSGPGTVQVQK